MSMLHASRKMILVLPLTLTLAACSPSTRQQVLRPNLPEPPESLGKPVPVLQLRKGVKLRAFIAQQRRQQHLANKRLRDDREWVEDLIRNYSNTEQPEAK